MTDIFRNLLVSCPNGGGLFLAQENNVFKLDNVDTVGLWFGGQELLRGVQPETFWVHKIGAPDSTKIVDKIGDIHDVLEWGGHYYVVSTTKNEVIKLDFNGEIMQRWSFAGEDDSMHLNCLGVWAGRLVFSAFGDFEFHRGYKGMTKNAGFVQDLESGNRIIHGLSQPHSLVEANGNLLVANSELRELREYSPEGKCVRSEVLDGYTRGICQVGGVIYVGLSQSRNIEEGGINSAAVVALDAFTWQEVGRIALAAREVYSIVSISDATALMSAVSATVGQSAELRRTQLQTANISLERLSEQTEAAIQQLNENERILTEQLQQLEIQLQQKQLDLALVHSSISWRLTRPIRWLGRVVRGE